MATAKSPVSDCRDSPAAPAATDRRDDHADELAYDRETYHPDATDRQISETLWAEGRLVEIVAEIRADRARGEGR